MKKPLLFFWALSVVLCGNPISSNAQERQEYTSQGIVEFVPSTDPNAPVDPEKPNPEKPVQPIDPTDPNGPSTGTTGPLSIDYVSSFDFGRNQISNQDQVYFARAQKYQNSKETTPNYVQVSDNRGTKQGWTLTVKQVEQFKAVTPTKNTQLTGAQMMFSNPVVNSNSQEGNRPEAVDSLILTPGNTTVVMTAKAGAGSGLWITYWGTVEEVNERKENGTVERVAINKDVRLFVPGATPKDAVTYQTKLRWALMAVPGN